MCSIIIAIKGWYETKFQLGVEVTSSKLQCIVLKKNLTSDAGDA
jgi:hypothetical protein